MRIANGKTAMRIVLAEADLIALTGASKTGVSLSVAFNGLKNPEDFLEISKNDIPGGERVNIIKNDQPKWPFVMVLNRVRFPKLERLPLFGPEEVEYAPQNHHQPHGWYIRQPKMTAPYMEKHYMGRGEKKKAPLPPAKPSSVSQLVSTTMSLKQAVQVVNDHKADMGDDLLLEITAQGRLRALMDLGS